MFFYIDESGHTGQNLFDPAQPVLYYGLISCALNLDAVGEERLKGLRCRLGADRLHATEIGLKGLTEIASDLARLQRATKFRFDLFRVMKTDLAVLCFFEGVFDVRVNPAFSLTYTATPLRFALLQEVAALFDVQLIRDAWAARIGRDAPLAEEGLQRLCQQLLERVDQIRDRRCRQLIADALRWAERHARDLALRNRGDDFVRQTSPNLVAFRMAITGIADRLRRRGCGATKIVVD